MPYLKPELLANENVLGEYGCTVYMVHNGLSSAGSNVRLWLTDQRLILKAGFGPQRTLALYGITNVSEEKVGFHTMARIEFSSGHLEWFTVQNQPQFLDALRAAQAHAPVISDVPVPAASAPGAGGSRVAGVTFSIIIATALVVCACISLAMLGMYWYMTSLQ